MGLSPTNSKVGTYLQPKPLYAPRPATIGWAQGAGGGVQTGFGGVHIEAVHCSCTMAADELRLYLNCTFVRSVKRVLTF